MPCADCVSGASDCCGDGWLAWANAGASLYGDTNLPGTGVIGGGGGTGVIGGGPPANPLWPGGFPWDARDNWDPLWRIRPGGTHYLPPDPLPPYEPPPRGMINLPADGTMPWEIAPGVEPVPPPGTRVPPDNPLVVEPPSGRVGVWGWLQIAGDAVLIHEALYGAYHLACTLAVRQTRSDIRGLRQQIAGEILDLSGQQDALDRAARRCHLDGPVDPFADLIAQMRQLMDQLDGLLRFMDENRLCAGSVWESAGVVPDNAQWVVKELARIRGALDALRRQRDGRLNGLRDSLARNGCGRGELRLSPVTYTGPWGGP